MQKFKWAYIQVVGAVLVLTALIAAIGGDAASGP